MEIRTVTQIFFSPTGTTRKVTEAIVRGIRPGNVVTVDLTPHDGGQEHTAENNGGLVIIASPVHAGRLPKDMVARMKRVRGNGALAAIVAVYGNRAYDDALLELRDVAGEAGFRPIAAGAFIGEHSFSTGAMPIAAGRPDAADVLKAEEFGKRIREKMTALQAVGSPNSLRVPGNFPYKERPAASNISPITQESLCEKCEKCSSVCPTGAISMGDTVQTAPAACIRCCACVKVCPSGARVMNEPRIRQIAENLSKNCMARKEPEFYF